MAEQVKQELENKSGDGSNGQKEVKKEGETTTPPASGETVEIEAAALEKLQTTLEKAEHTIVELKKAQKAEKGAGDGKVLDDADLEAKIDAKLQEKLAALEANKADKNDATLKELEAARTVIKELTVVAKSKKGITNSGVGTNQDKNIPEPEPNYSPADLAIIRRNNLDPKTLKKIN